MKKMLFAFVLMTMPLFALKESAQDTTAILEREEQPSTDTTVYKVVEKMPEYPEGMKTLARDAQTFAQKYIKEHFPDTKNNPYWWPDPIAKRSIVSFIIHENGQITDAVITRSSEDPHSDRAALLFVKSMSHWIPGEQNGKKVKVKSTLPFTLHIQ